MKQRIIKFKAYIRGNKTWKPHTIYSDNYDNFAQFFSDVESFREQGVHVMVELIKND